MRRAVGRGNGGRNGRSTAAVGRGSLVAAAASRDLSHTPGSGGNSSGSSSQTSTRTRSPYPGLKIPAEVNAFRNNWKIQLENEEHSVKEPHEVLQFLADRLKSVLIYYATSVTSALRELGRDPTPFEIIRLLADDFLRSVSMFTTKALVDRYFYA